MNNLMPIYDRKISDDDMGYSVSHIFLLKFQGMLYSVMYLIIYVMGRIIVNVKNVLLLMIMSYGLSSFASDNQRIVAEQNYIIDAQKRNDEEKQRVTRDCVLQAITQQGTWMACDAMKDFNDVDGIVITCVKELWAENMRYSYLLARDKSVNLPWMIAFTDENETLAYESRPKYLTLPCIIYDPSSVTVELA